MEQGLEVFGRRRRMEEERKAQTLPSSPCHSLHSSSSSDFEFSISISPRKSSPADELFYRGQILPLHTLILSSSSATSSSTDTSHTNSDSRRSTASHSSNDSQYCIHGDLLSFYPDCRSSSPSSLAEDDEFKSQPNSTQIIQADRLKTEKSDKPDSLPIISALFRKELGKKRDLGNFSKSRSGSSAKGLRGAVRELIRKYMKKAKPLCEKLSQPKQPSQKVSTAVGFCSESHPSPSSDSEKSTGVPLERSTRRKRSEGCEFSQSLFGNFTCPRRNPCISSCPSSTMSSPSHSRLLSRAVFSVGAVSRSDRSSTEALQSAIQGAIAHCKNSLLPNQGSSEN